MFILDGYDAPIPKGLILFYNSTSIPSGFSAFSSANDKAIVGAGNIYSSGASGGSPWITSVYSGYTGSGGNHLNGEVNAGNPPLPNPPNRNYYENTAGDHYHNYGNVYYRPSYNSLLLIKADKNHSKLPANSIVLSSQSRSTNSNILQTGEYIYIKSAIGHQNVEQWVALSSAGDHSHYSKNDQSDGSGSAYILDQTGGAHTGDVPLVITESIKKVLLSAWTNTSDFNIESNMIGLWENSTPPRGWKINTALQDCFFKTVASGGENITPTGDNTINIASVNTTISHYGQHTHYTLYGGTASSIQSTSDGHTDYDWYHSHAISLSSKTNVPYTSEYYALYFITKI